MQNFEGNLMSFCECFEVDYDFMRFASAFQSNTMQSALGMVLSSSLFLNFSKSLSLPSLLSSPSSAQAPGSCQVLCGTDSYHKREQACKECPTRSGTSGASPHRGAAPQY